MLLKYASATLKNFAAPLGIIINILLSHLRPSGDAPPPNPKFVLGAALVTVALLLWKQLVIDGALSKAHRIGWLRIGLQCSRAGPSRQQEFVASAIEVYTCVMLQREAIEAWKT